MGMCGPINQGTDNITPQCRKWSRMCKCTRMGMMQQEPLIFGVQMRDSGEVNLLNTLVAMKVRVRFGSWFDV